MAAGPAVTDWRNYGGVPEGQRFAQIDQINVENVGKLKEAWRARTGSRAVKYNTGDIPRAGSYCELFVEDLVDACLRGMGSYWAVHWMGERRRADVCDQLLDPELAERCRYAIDGSA